MVNGPPSTGILFLKNIGSRGFQSHVSQIIGMTILVLKATALEIPHFLDPYDYRCGDKSEQGDRVGKTMGNHRNI